MGAYEDYNEDKNPTGNLNIPAVNTLTRLDPKLRDNIAEAYILGKIYFFFSD